MRDTALQRAKGPGGWSLLGAAATLMALLSCYGTLLLVAALSLLGISLAVDEGLWSGAILAATGIALLALLASFLRHRRVLPLLSALAGAALIFYALLGTYHALLEGGGFALLFVATLLDLRASRRTRFRSGQ